MREFHRIFRRKSTASKVDRNLSEKLWKGESITAIVLFVYVAGFRDLLQNEDPANLLQDLNFSLRSISAAILKEGQNSWYR
ncbi:MAG: hypothetical protein HQM08_27150 [Candidatus Riflebacteria bacterium]|nr:hypothetical protein [Candidatus Riflebacteria bacterium]